MGSLYNRKNLLINLKFREMKRRISETQLIQNYGVLFKNAKFESVLAGELAEYGYDAATIEQGEALYNILIEKYNTNKTESAQEPQLMQCLIQL